MVPSTAQLWVQTMAFPWAVPTAPALVAPTGRVLVETTGSNLEIEAEMAMIEKLRAFFDEPTTGRWAVVPPLLKVQ